MAILLLAIIVCLSHSAPKTRQGFLPPPSESTHKFHQQKKNPKMKPQREAVTLLYKLADQRMEMFHAAQRHHDAKKAFASLPPLTSPDCRYQKNISGVRASDDIDVILKTAELYDRMQDTYEAYHEVLQAYNETLESVTRLLNTVPTYLSDDDSSIDTVPSEVAGDHYFYFPENFKIPVEDIDPVPTEDISENTDRFSETTPVVETVSDDESL